MNQMFVLLVGPAFFNGLVGASKEFLAFSIPFSRTSVRVRVSLRGKEFVFCYISVVRPAISSFIAI